MHDPNDTICALSTPPGRAGIALVRMSGLRTFEILGRIFVTGTAARPLPPRTATLGRIVDPVEGDSIDQALVTCFPAPHSYTGENLAEISVHGNPVVAAFVLDSLCSCGARLAEPGEFTQRAFVHGRLDLAQAEAVRDIIEATTLYQVQVAERQHSGELSRRLEPIKKLLIEVIVNLESAVEFVEEDLPLESRESLAARLGVACEVIAGWIASFRRGRIIREGFSLAVVGRPNVGKSSLFNALLAQERSIVTEIPGTTRDAIAEVTSVGGVPVRLVDTAGVRVSHDPVERIGVDRSYQAMADSDALLLVTDASVPPDGEDWALRERLAGLPCIVVVNKGDLPSGWTGEQMRQYAGTRPLVQTSALTGAGLDDLRCAVQHHLFGNSGAVDGVLITSLRHRQCLEAAAAHLGRAAEALRDAFSEEYVLLDLHAGLRELGKITGETSVEDLLGEIFSRFCVGK
jgi:tRNA modification GTPase